eukprot:2597170-Pyramimonas_sp.AAC.1
MVPRLPPPPLRNSSALSLSYAIMPGDASRNLYNLRPPHPSSSWLFPLTDRSLSSGSAAPA